MFTGEPGVTSEKGTGISIVMPALNEEATVGQQVRAILSHQEFGALPIAQVIVVDNGSVDGTASAARDAGALVVSQPQRGYGAACLTGVLAAADTDIVLLMDADGSDDLDGAARIAAVALAGTAELVMGSRNGGAMERGALTSQQRVGNAVATLLLWLISGQRVTDLGPVRAIRRADLLALDMSEMTYGWSAEMMVKAARAGYRIVELPVDYHCRRGGRSKVSGTIHGTVRAGWCILATMLRYARWRQAQPAATPI